MDDATALVRAKTALEELGSAAAHRIGERRAERLVDDVSAGLVELARVNQAAIGELLAERDEARAENERLRRAWNDACDVAIAMSGASAFSPGGEAHEAWVSWMRPKLHAALAAAQEPPAWKARVFKCHGCGRVPLAGTDCSKTCSRCGGVYVIEGDECGSCIERFGRNECPKSKRWCGHHCNHVLTHDACDWCGGHYEEETWVASQEPPAEPKCSRPDCDCGGRILAHREPPAERTSSEPNGCKRVRSGECSGPDDPWCACTDQMLRAAAQEPPAEIVVEITDVGPVTGNLPTTRLLARLNLDGLADAQEPPAEGGDRG